MSSIVATLGMEAVVVVVDTSETKETTEEAEGDMLGEEVEEEELMGEEMEALTSVQEGTVNIVDQKTSAAD